MRYRTIAVLIEGIKKNENMNENTGLELSDLDMIAEDIIELIIDSNDTTNVTIDLSTRGLIKHFSFVSSVNS